MHTFSFIHTTITVLKRQFSSTKAVTNPHLSVNTALKYTEWTGKKDGNWENEENWSDGLPFRYQHAYIPRVPRGNNFPVITEATQIDFTIKNEGVLTNHCRTEITKIGLLQNNGILDNHADAQLVNNGKLVNQGCIQNNGLINQRNVLCNLHKIINNGTIAGENRIFQLANSLKADAAQDSSILNLIQQLKFVEEK